MSWTSKPTKLAALALALGAAGAATAGTIVVRSAGPSARDFPPGKALSTGKVTLRAGDSLVLLDGRGTRTLSGPGSFALGASETASAAPSALGALLRNTGARQVRTGAVRGVGNVSAKSPNLWYVDTSKSGTVCLADATRPMLWRQTMTAPATMMLTRAGEGKSANVSFAAGQSIRPWPTGDMPIVEGADYRLQSAGMPQPMNIRFAMVGSSAAALDDLGAALIRKGCNGQLDLLIDTAIAAAPGPGTG